jgi:hypothetical protein
MVLNSLSSPRGAALTTAYNRRMGAQNGSASGAGEGGRLHLSSEFASVSIEVDQRANGPRLRIENRQNRRVIYLDPLELASLTWLTHDHLGPFLDPSQTGWRSEEGD